MRVLTISFIVLFTMQPAHADFAFQGLKLLCTMEKFEISSVTLENQEPTGEQVATNDGGTIFFDNKEHITQCKVGTHIIKVRHSNSEHSLSGACGMAPGSWVALWLDGVAIFQGGVFNNECQESFDKVVFLKEQKSDFSIEFCGHGSPSNMFTECLKYQKSQFMSFKFPLPPFEMSWLRDNKPLEPTR
jgi:hypothetical protein